VARYQTTKDKTVRARWAQFLGSLVGDGRAVTAQRLGKVMSAQRSSARKGDATWQVWEWLEGERTVSPPLAFEAGEALRACDVAWCSGPLALYAAGYLSAWVETIASIESLTGGDETAIELALLTPIAVLRDGDLRADLGDAAEAWREGARSALAETFAGVQTETMRWAFEHEPDALKMLLLGPAASAARNADSDPGEPAIESLVLSTLREWAISKAKAEPRKAIVKYTFRLQQLRMERIVGDAAEADSRPGESFFEKLHRQLSRQTTYGHEERAR
jgi:hypothetical protein